MINQLKINHRLNKLQIMERYKNPDLYELVEMVTDKKKMLELKYLIQTPGDEFKETFRKKLLEYVEQALDDLFKEETEKILTEILSPDEKEMFNEIKEIIIRKNA